MKSTQFLPTLTIICLFATLNTPYSHAVTAEDQARLSGVLEWVYKTMNDEYYLKVDKSIYDSFLKSHTAEVLSGLNEKTHQTEDFIHLGAGLLVNKLKDPIDRFSSFVPPKIAEEYKGDIYAARADLGLKGSITKKGWSIETIAKHCDAYAEGLRIGDFIMEINEASILDMTNEAIAELLTPEVGSKTTLSVFFTKLGETDTIELESKSYFLETVSIMENNLSGVLGLKIAQFNRKTSEDFSDILEEYGVENIKHLIIDLRNNKGGPPLAAREIMGFFTMPQDPLFFIVRKNRKPFLLASPIGLHYYEGPITVLVNHKTASAAETLSGVLKEKRLAQVVGQQTNGASYLKSMYDYDDGSTMMLVTSRTFYHNYVVFPPDGITPDITIADEVDGFAYVLDTLKEN